MTLGNYSKFAKVYGEHVRLCLNALSLNLLTAKGDHDNQADQLLQPHLTRACEAAISIVNTYAASDNTEFFVAYGADYLVLILAQAAVFFVRILTSRVKQPLTVDQTVLRHYLKQAIDLLELNDLSTTEVCGWVARLCRSLMRFTGLCLELAGNLADTNGSMISDSTFLEPEWDFDVSAFLGQDMTTGGTGFDLSGYFDFTRSFLPPSYG
ncbi:uncharacterized protein NECHADRAFT_55924 [Fusarium vanettenii 77-13-4]|uniref:Transcription factor domain-containing protein n=1 Tax=Fusarium vanettenii (strain ATCC MYA-4622 / CBS 123669 / FGSC 9596 / NRRL 45880 / 77-13-4) TaxID=660122 RepID=C7ZQ54_FUSV7|nr:uncharacterized protein NECHADRAFT_55924 [Fusarium vanettenii 77-13-4]EEU33849.1 hypothetical protein NECHADRAFT_55924 [Fusarium vanettenii 77-13-4]